MLGRNALKINMLLVALILEALAFHPPPRCRQTDPNLDFDSNLRKELDLAVPLQATRHLIPHGLFEVLVELGLDDVCAGKTLQLCRSTAHL
jgi:hypothetical protein